MRTPALIGLAAGPTCTGAAFVCVSMMVSILVIGQRPCEVARSDDRLREAIQSKEPGLLSLRPRNDKPGYAVREYGP